MDDCCEVTLVEKLRSVPKGYIAILWASNGAQMGHKFIPVGYMVHEAADEIERLQKLVGEPVAYLFKVRDNNTVTPQLREFAAIDYHEQAGETIVDKQSLFLRERS